MSNPPAPLYGLLLSGGASQRMRQDKAALAYRGEPQLLRAWRLLEALTERAFVSVRDSQRDDTLRAGLPQIVDSYDAIGRRRASCPRRIAIPTPPGWCWPATCRCWITTRCVA